MADDVDFDVIIVGAGVAGCVCAYKVAMEGHSVVLMDRGETPGSKNLSGGIFYCQIMESVFPNFVQQAPVERIITRNCVSFLNPQSAVAVDYWDERLHEPVNAVSVLRAKLSLQCENAGVMVMPGVRVDSILWENGAAVGVRAGEDELRAHIVVAADGVNSFLARDSRVRTKEPRENLAVGVKSVIRLPQALLENRFNVRGDSGVAYSFVGDCTCGIAGGGFLYTNRDSLSVGVVLRLDELADSGLSSSHVHDHFLEHPFIASLIDDGELLEYGCHLTIENGPAMGAQVLTRPGLMLIGDAAGFTLNTGLTIRGMDLAAGSALAASRAIHRALEKNDFGQEAMDTYPKNLSEGFVGKDLATYARAPEFLDNKRVYTQYGLLLSDVMHEVYNLNTVPREHLARAAARTLRGSKLRVRDVVRDVWHGLRAL